MIRILKIFLSLGVGLFLGGWILVGYVEWLHTSPTFQIRRIEIEGNDLIPDPEIRSLMRGGEGDLIWALDLEESEKRIRSNPFVASVRVSRRFPATVQVRIKEKEPLALVKVGSRFYAIDDSGLVLPTKPGRLYDLPIITPAHSLRPVIGKRLASQEVQEGLDFLRMVVRDRSALYREISEVLPCRPNGLQLYTRSGIPVRMGRAQPIQIRALEAVVHELHPDPERIHYIDLRYHGQVILGIRT